jgi:hypothetical protein
MKTYYFRLLCGLWIIIAACSCSRMNDLHDEYLKDGEILYTGKVDSATVFAGERRVMLRYYTSDPKAKNLIIYWNFRNESKQLAIPAKNATDPVDVWIEPLEEGPVYFELVTLDENMQNKSVPYSVDGTAYGDMFRSTMMNRNLRSIIRDYYDNNVTIGWYNADTRSIGVELRYTDRSGATVEYTVPPGEGVTVFTDVAVDAEYIQYRTVYMPEPTAVDVFYTGWRQIDILTGKPIELEDNGVSLPDLEGINFY